MAKRKRGRQKQSLSKGVGCFILVGVLGLIGAIGQAAEASPATAFVLVGFLGGIVILAAAFSALRRSSQSKKTGDLKQASRQQPHQTESQQQQEKKLYQLALRNHGRLTVIEVAAELSISLAEAETMLADIVRRGHATEQRSEKGYTVYTFSVSPASSARTPPQEPESQTVQCLITGKAVPATPEEHVRQQVAALLITRYGYQQRNLDVEFPIRMGRARKRADLVIFPENAPHVQERIWGIFEMKPVRTSVAELEDAEGQLKSYVAASLNCQYAVLAWGKMRVYRIVTQDGKRTFIREQHLPMNYNNGL